MKQLENTFQRAGFAYTLVKRDGAAALYTKTFVNKPDGPSWFEVVRLIKDEEGNESFPAPSSWGILGLTLPSSKQAEAEQAYTNFVSEYGAEAEHPVDSAVFVETNSNDEQPEPLPVPEPKLAHILPVNPPPLPTAADVKPKAARGRKKLDVQLNIPDNGTFQARELADESGMSVPFVHNRLKNLVSEGVIEVHDKVQGKRGKPIILFKKKGVKV